MISLPIRLALLAALALAFPAAAQTWTPATFTSAAGDVVAAEQAILTVKESSAAGAPDIRLPVVRFKATADHPGPPIVYLAGGPGASGLVSAQQAIFPVLMRLRAAGDVVVFDQRGTGKAEPSLTVTGAYALPADKPMAGPEVAARFAEVARAGAAEIKGRGIDLASYNTVRNAEDVEALRVFLGAGKLVLWGHSYGSHLGLAYLKAHPDRVAKAVFGGVNDLGNRWRLPSDGDALLVHIDAAIRQDPRMAERIPDFLGLVRRVFERLEAHPQTVAVKGVSTAIGRDELATLIALQAGDIGFIRDLPALFVTADGGDFSRIAGAIQQLRTQPVGTAMRHGMHVASGVSPERTARIRAEIPGSLMGDAINYPYNLPAFTEGWGVPDLGEAFRAATPSDIPVLFMNGEFDGRTSVREAKETASRFANGAFVEIGGVSHDFYGFSPAIPDAMLAFITTGAKPPARIVALPTEFRSPDDAKTLMSIGLALKLGGKGAAVRKLQELAAAKSGPYFNVVSARTAGNVAAGDLKDPEAAMALLEAADRLWPHDFAITRQLAVLYRGAGRSAEALAKFEALRAINPLAPGIDVDIAKLRAATSAPIENPASKP